MNVELLEKVKEQIMLEPKLLDMSSWEDMRDRDGNWGDQRNICNTAHCICGWAASIKYKLTWGKAIDKAEKEYNEDFTYEEDFGMAILELPNSDLFHVCNWPSRFADKYENYLQPLRRARVACEAIDDYIKTGGWEDE